MTSKEKIEKGDIIKNNFAGTGNPIKYLLYLGKGTIKQGRYTHSVYKCLSFEGKKVNLFTEKYTEGLPVMSYIGHMDEYDAFIKKLRTLKDFREVDNG